MVDETALAGGGMVGGDESARAGGDGGGLKDLLALARPYWRTLAVAGVLGLIGSAAALAQPLAAREVVEALAADDSLLAPVLLLGALVVAGALVAGLHLWLLERTAERIVLGVRLGVIARLLRLRVAEHDAHPPGELVARATSDTTLVRSAATSALVQAFNGAIGLAGAIVLMGILDLRLLGVTLAVLVVVGGTVGLVLPRIMRATVRAQAAVGEVGGALDRALGAIRTVKAAGAEAREEARAAAAARRAFAQGMATARYQAVLGVGTGLAIQVAFLAVLGVGGALAADGEFSVATLIAFLLYLFYLAEPVTNIAAGANQLQEGRAAMQRLGDVERMAREEDPASSATAAADGAAPGTPATAPGVPAVALEDVTLRYAPDRPPALDGLTLSVGAGGQTALVGPSGAGKTSVFALLQRFYDATEGTVRLFGTDVTALPRAEVRRRLALVEQEAPVLAGTLRETSPTPRRTPRTPSSPRSCARRVWRSSSRACRRGWRPRSARGGDAVRRRAPARRDRPRAASPARRAAARRGHLPAGRPQ
jgi:ATP-binding cassette subfamily B protein/ATP-binding cassette subfamily C protein